MIRGGVGSLWETLPPPLKLGAIVALSLVAVEAFSLVESSGGNLEVWGFSLHIEVDVALLGVTALLILLSTPIAAMLGITPAIVELVFGVYLAYRGAEVNEALKIISGIGANMLLFMAGTEIDVGFLKRTAGKALSVAALTLIPAVPVVAYMTRGAPLEASILVFATLTATSVALTFTLFDAYKVVRARAAQLVLAAAMILDVLGMILINVATAAINPLLILYGLVILAAFALQPILPRITGAPFEMEIRLVAMALIVLGVLSEVLGIHGVLTSFILGLIVSETVKNRRVLREKIEGLATGFFTPFFFIVSGMSIGGGVELLAVLEALALGVVLAASKLGIIYFYIKRFMGVGRQMAVVAASGAAPLLTVTIIGAEIGYDLGLIDGRTYSMLIWVVVASSLTAVMAVKLSYRL
ncbi:MAG: cation:proton antiporter [Desulfurococcales archaeon]|nr:cation:proton antiporter [Desulfurococcales archaeon]